LSAKLKMKNLQIDKNKILLILDLDETLIHATKEDIGYSPDFMVFDYNVYKRPYVTDFLSNLSQDFYLALWSTASENYIDRMISEIAPLGFKFEFVWGQTKATYKRVINVDQYNYEDFSEFQYIKRLKKVKSLGFRLEKTLMVDDTPHKVRENYGNAIYIKEFKGNLNDNELFYLEKYLKSIKDLENVRIVEKRNWRKEIQKIKPNPGNSI